MLDAIVGLYFGLLVIGVLTIRALVLGHASGRWWVVLGVLVAVSFPIGLWCAFATYSINDEVQLSSFPIPAVMLHREDGQWIDYVSPALPVIVFANVSAIVLASLLPIFFTLAWRGELHILK